MTYPLLVALAEWVNGQLPSGYSLRWWVYDFDDTAKLDADAEMKAAYRRWLAANDPDRSEITADGTDEATAAFVFVLRHVSGARVIRLVTIQQVRTLIANNPTLTDKRQALRTVVLNWKTALDARIGG